MPSSKSHSCKELHEALDKALDILGAIAKETVNDTLRRRGISIMPPCSPIDEIERAMVDLFGDAAAELLMEDVRMRMDTHKD